MKNLNEFKTVTQMVRFFDTKQKCLDYLAEKRWKGKPCCPHCNHEKVYILKGKTNYKCSNCKRLFNPLTNTVMQGTHINLQDWFYVFYIFGNHKKGVSSKQIARDLQITYKSAWFMTHRVRQAMRHRSFKLEGIIEIDETFVGGKNKNRHYNRRYNNF